MPGHGSGVKHVRVNDTYSDFDNENFPTKKKNAKPRHGKYYTKSLRRVTRKTRGMICATCENLREKFYEDTMLVKKYVIVKNEFPILFDEKFQHVDMAYHGDVSSAGFFLVDDGKLHCFGESATLNIGPGENDEKILASFLNIK